MAGKKVESLYCYYNGVLRRQSEAVISPLDAGVLSGYGLFETMRARQGRILNLGRHLRRLHAGCAKLDLQSVPDIPTFEEALQQVICNNEAPDLRIRLTVTAESIYSQPTSQNMGVNVLITATPLSPLPKTPVIWDAQTCLRPVFSKNPLLQVKNTSRLDYALAQREAWAVGCKEALRINEWGRYTEGTVSNLFIFNQSGMLLTPPLSEGLLPGITRQIVLELAKEIGIEAQEEPLCKAAINSAREVLLSNAVRGIVALQRIDGMNAGSVVPGPVTCKLWSAYLRKILPV